MKTLFQIKTLIILTFSLLAWNAWAAEGDDGMITQVQGAVTYSAGPSKDKPVTSFTKVKAGDKINVAKDGKLQVVYYQNGRQETWKGEAKVTIGKTESAAGAGTAAPTVKKLPDVVLQQLTRAPGVVTDLKNRTGMIMVRSLPMLKMSQLEENYAAMRKDAAEDDVTPELYKLAGLHELKLYRDMKPVLEDMRRRQPNNPEVEAVYKHYSDLMNPDGKEK